MTCRICGEREEAFSTATILGRHEVRYFRCATCGFVHTEEPYWLDEAYSRAISITDIGLVGRNQGMAALSRGVINTLFSRDARFLDWGGGYGLFVRMMRDSGFDFRWHDKYCENLFACGFELQESPRRQFELVTAFEVIEHLVDPVGQLEEMLAFSDSVLFSTELMPPSVPRPNEWWYYSLGSGQHVSFFGRETLEALGRRLKVNVFTDDGKIHLLSRRRLRPWLFRLVCRSRVVGFVARRRGMKRSLAGKDFLALTGARLDE